MDLYYIYDSNAELYLNLMSDVTTKVKEWIGWRSDALEVPPGVSVYNTIIKTRFTIQEVLTMEAKYDIVLLPHILQYQNGDDKHLQI